MLLNTIKDNFDINIFDRAQYENPGCEENVWVLCPYTIIEEYSGYGTGDYMEELNLVLTEEEAEAHMEKFFANLAKESRKAA